MIFDPFGDAETAGYLRNIHSLPAGDTLKKLENFDFVRFLPDALARLKGLETPQYTDLLTVHHDLFCGLYPWAGQDRFKLFPNSMVSKGNTNFALSNNIQNRRASVIYSLRPQETTMPSPMLPTDDSAKPCAQRRRGPWRPVEQAAAWAQAQGIKSGPDWLRRAATPGWLPHDIPVAPWSTYKNEPLMKEGGPSWFLGTSNIATRKQHASWRPIEQAAEWARAQGLKTARDWKRLVATPGWLPDDIPTFPYKAYKRELFMKMGGWVWFLGTPYVATKNREFLSLEEASKWVMKQKIRSQRDWTKRCGIPGWKPSNIPRHPWSYYGGAAFQAFGGLTAFFGLAANAQTSTVERLLRAVLDECFDPGANHLRVQSTPGKSSKNHSLDMFYPNIGLILEYDGVYFHKHRVKFDEAKTTDLTSAEQGWKVIRVREKCLDLLDHTWDVSVDPNKSIEVRIEQIIDHIIGLCNKGHLKIDGNLITKLAQTRAQLDLDKYDEAIRMPRNTRPIAEASKWAQERGIKTRGEWMKKGKEPGWLPIDIPLDPRVSYGGKFFASRGGWAWFLGGADKLKAMPSAQKPKQQLF